MYIPLGSMKIFWNNTLDSKPSSFQSFHHFLRQRSLLHIHKVALQLGGAASTHNDSITLLPRHTTVMRQSSKGTFSLCQTVLLRNRTDYIQRIEIKVIPIAAPVQTPLPPFGIKARARLVILRSHISSVPRGQEPTRQRLEAIEGNPIMAQTGKQVQFDGTVQDIVDALIDNKLNPSILFTDLADLCTSQDI